MGSKRTCRSRWSEEVGFQTDPCGVEAITEPALDKDDARFRRTLVGSKPFLTPRFRIYCIGFRRTLVGSKRGPDLDLSSTSDWFQTDPCGVEAREGRRESALRSVFQTDPCGVEAPGHRLVCLPDSRFQTDPCGVEALWNRTCASCRRLVSDGPLWGRSTDERQRMHVDGAFQTDPCGVEARLGGPRTPSRRFQTDPCGVEAVTTFRTLKRSRRFQTDPCGVEARWR